MTTTLELVLEIFVWLEHQRILCLDMLTEEWYLQVGNSDRK